MRLASVNQDRGIDPKRSKGASVHVAEMRRAFRTLGVQVLDLDEPDDRALWSALEDFEPDLIYERYALGKAAATEFAGSHGVRRVLEVNAPLAREEQDWRGRAIDQEQVATDRKSFSTATLVTSVSNAVAGYCKDLGTLPERLLVLPNGVDADRFRPAAREGAKRRLEIPEDSIVLGFHGRLRPWHDFPTLVSAARRLLEQHPVHVVTVGKGEFERHLATQLPRERYTCVDWVEHKHVPNLIGAFDLLPLTYSPDREFYFSPLKLAEAMAVGVVPVVPDLGDLGELVDHGISGLVYPGGDVEGLNAALRLMAKAPRLRSRIGARAAQVASTWSWVSIAERILDRLQLPRSRRA